MPFTQAKLRLANNLIRLGHRRAADRFRSGLDRPKERQETILRRLVTANQESRYGLAHGFSDLRSVEDFQRRVPLMDYDGLEPWIELVKKGEPRVLTVDPVLMLEKSGGSTAASKYVPYTAGLRREFQAATAAWLHDLLTRRPALRGGGAYWSVSPIAQEREVTEGGLRVGFEDDTEYFGALERWVLKQLMLVPPELRALPDMETNRYVALRHLLDRDDLALISVWNPSFLTLLMKEAVVQGDRLVRDLLAGTLTPPRPIPAPVKQRLEAGLRPRRAIARLLDDRLRRGEPILGTECWPNLQLISCWTSAIARQSLPDMQALFPGVEIQGKGLLATEGVVSFPLLDHPGSILATDSHFLEFLPEGAAADSRPLLAHELDVGGRYEVLLTTGGGLYRYALHDQIEVVGRLQATPLIEFVGKTAKVCDLVGEKLNELMVGNVLEAAFREAGLAPRFAMLAPHWGHPPSYTLFLELPGCDDERLRGLIAEVEGRLRTAYHYAYARDLGQLGPLRGQLVLDGQATYQAGCEALGQRAGNVKPTYLHKDWGWGERFVLPSQEFVIDRNPA
jgi:hypothetical protein